MKAKCVMVLGTSSGAGKSWLTTALCRWYARKGFKVAPFKAQNMSNNARVVTSHNGLGEIGSAQYFQALASYAEPDVRMNPLLLKPEADTHSQVVLLGEVSDALTQTPWRDRSEKVWPQIAASLDALRADNDIVVMEGETVAVLPMWWQHGLPEEDGVFDDRSRSSGLVTKTVAVIAYPRISNLDEFQPLKNVSGLRLVWARSPSDLAGLGKDDWIILPGSKNTSSDLRWLRSQGLNQSIVDHANHGRFVLGICGGLQILGEALVDAHGVDGNAAGLGLLPLVTTFEPLKTVKRTLAKFAHVRGVLSALSGIELSGYEIHHGQTVAHTDRLPNGNGIHEIATNLAWQNVAGNVTGMYLHGLFENPAVLKSLFGAETITLDTVFDGLADFLDQHVSAHILQKLIAT